MLPSESLRQDRARRSTFQPRAITLAIGILIIIFVAFGAYIAIRELRLWDISEGKRELTELDLLLEEETERTLQSVDLVLTSLQDDFALDGLNKPQDFLRKQSSIATYALLKSRIVGIPQLREVSIVGPQGEVVNISGEYPAPALNVTDRDYFKVLSAVPVDGPYLSMPVQDKDSGKWTVYLARQIHGSSSRFVGLVVAAIDLSYFENLYKSLQIGQGGAVSLWRRDGILLARYPSLPGSAGHNFEIPAFSGILQPDRPVTYDVGRSLDNQQRIVATMAVKQFPLVVNVSKVVDQILADWRQTASLITGGGALFILALCFVLWLLLRQFSAYEAIAIADEERSKAIAEREQAEAQLRQAQKLESIGQLTGGIAHDFNNLLTAVLGNLELLKKHTQHGESRVHRWASNAFDAANRGAVLTQRLLVFSRRQPLEPRAADLTMLLDSMSELLRRTLGENIEILTKIEVGLWPALADVNQLDNAILNIAINARDAMDGRGQLRITASNCEILPSDKTRNGEIKPGDYVLLAISDTGKGIEKEVLDRVFEPFFSTKPIGQGTGLGLSQVYGFVKQMGGHVRIDSAPSQGTTVELYLPRAESEEEPTPLLPPKAEKKQAQGPASGTVLIVEDDSDVRAYAAEILRDEGYDVLEVSDADAAIDILRENQDITLLFSDVGLSGMSGPELVEVALRMRPQLKVLLTSGYAQNPLIERCRFVHGVQLVPKPFSRTELAEKIAATLAPAEHVPG